MFAKEGGLQTGGNRRWPFRWTAGLRRLGLRRLAWLTEVRGLANRSEGLGRPGPVDKSDGFGWAGRTQGPSIKVRGLEGWAGPSPVDKSEGVGGQAGPPSLANPQVALLLMLGAEQNAAAPKRLQSL